MRRLDGTYTVGDYTLRPCLLTPRNALKGCSNFVLEFDFDWIDERSAINSAERFIYTASGEKIAKDFIAWLVVATREWISLSHQSSGHRMTYGPYNIEPVEDFDGSKLGTTFHIDKKAKVGEFLEVRRPEFSLNPLGRNGTLKLPYDVLLLTKKMLSLSKREREKFLNACFSYQFAFENWMAYPTVSLLSLVSAVESMTADESKKGVMKKFRAFFERNLEYPLSSELQSFLNRVYSKRSTFVHEALLGEGEARGIQFWFKSENAWQLDEEKRNLEMLVNAVLMEWLRRV